MAGAVATNNTEPKEEFVLDGSVALAWFFLDEQTPYATDVAQRLTRARAIVPSIWIIEIANVLVLGERRNRCTEAMIATWLNELSTFDIQIDYAPPATIWGEVLRLARKHKLTAYDAAYLELALRRNLPFATLDKQLLTALHANSVTLYAKV